MKVYGNPGSTCTRKVLTVFAEAGVKPNFELIDLGTGQHKSPEFMAHQPFGQVPALEDDGFELYESRAMIRYLDDKLGTKLTPSDAKGRARMDQWISVETSNFTPIAMKIVYQKLLAPMRGQTTDENAVAEARKNLAKPLDIMEKQLEKTPYFAGDQFTLADICFMPYFEYLFMAQSGDLIESRPNLAKWWKNVSERKSWQVASGKAN